MIEARSLEKEFWNKYPDGKFVANSAMVKRLILPTETAVGGRRLKEDEEEWRKEHYQTNLCSIRAVPGSISSLDLAQKVVVSPLNPDGVAILAVKNGPLNILDLATIKSMKEHLETLEKHKHCTGIIITAYHASSKAFSVGFDLKEFIKYNNAQRLRIYLGAVMDLWMQLYATRLITIATINGLAVGGAGVLAACCDRRVFEENAVIGFNEVRMGLALPEWVLDRLIQLMGYHKTEYVVTSATLMDARKAERYGLVDRLVAANESPLDAALDQLRSLRPREGCIFRPIKLAMRRQIIDQFVNEREKILDDIVGEILSPRTQKVLHDFMKKG